MPKISVVIPAYNVDKYLARCLDSLLAQAFGDWEAVVVDDASTDGTGALADNYAARDPRVHVVRHAQNQGRHLARRSGVTAATGDYLIFLDGDDELVGPAVLGDLADAMEADPADSLRFGLEALPEEGTLESAATGFMAWSNHETDDLDREGLLRSMFCEEGGYVVPWHVTHRLYAADVVRRAFASMAGERLQRGEDAYECLVIAMASKRERCRTDIMGYRYHMGAGVTKATAQPTADFEREAADVARVIEASRAQVAGMGDLEHDCAEGLAQKLTETLMNNWHERVAANERPAAARKAAQLLGAAAVDHELWRFVRDRSYELYDHSQTPALTDELYDLLRQAREVGPYGGTDAQMERAWGMRAEAMVHVHELEPASTMARFEAEPVRILVTTHKKVSVPEGTTLQPIQVGPGNKSTHGRFNRSLHDDTGDNISDKNPMYCEMTTQYWAWKNVASDYVGFCHYRRYFNFSDTTYGENPFGEVMDDFIDDDAIRKYGLDDEHVRVCVEGYDLITTGVHDLRDFPGDFSTPREHYQKAERLHYEDLLRCEKIVRAMYPDYDQDVTAFLDGHLSCFCNMYIMRKPIFDSYCEWLFPILDEWCAQTDMTTYSREAMRTPGHLAERLFNIWRLHQLRMHPEWKVKELQCVHFEHPEPPETFTPVFERQPTVRRADVVPVVFAADNNYVPVLTVAMDSMMRNASPDRFYEVMVLNTDIGGGKQLRMWRHFERYPNMRLTFFNVWRMVKDYKLDTNNAHISVETYFRFLVQQILRAYNKVVYLDSDLVVNGDVAELFDTDLGDTLIAATRDVDYLANLNQPDGIRMRYTTGVLQMRNPYDYFQAGVLVLNTQEMRRLHTVSEWLRIATRPDFIYNDQDILNAECEGRVTYLPGRWNVTNNIFGRVDKLYPWAPSQVFDDYQAGRADPQVVHYAGAIKPWQNASIDLGGYFWNYARQTPFYEQILQSMVPEQNKDDDVVEYHERAIPDTSPLRKVIDPFLPYGSERRERAKAIARALQGKK